jgi:hypothetical protein
MRLPDVCFARLSVRATTVSLLAVLFLPMACVSLDKPAEVAACSATKSCRDNVMPGEGGKDAGSGGRDGTGGAGGAADVRPEGGSGGTQDDVAVDKPGQPDASADKGKQDVAGPETGSPETASAPDASDDAVVFADVGPQPSDVRVDLVDVAGREDVAKEDVAKEDVIKEDLINEDVVKEDVVKLDLPGPETLSNCQLFYGEKPATGSAGHPPGPGSSGEFCVATCDDIAGWGCSNFDSGRKVTVNGTAVSCGDAPKKSSYYIFRVTAGTDSSQISASIYWWSGTWATSCSIP